MSGVLSVSNQTLNEGAGASINLAGSYDTLILANGDYVGLLAGTDDTINLSDGSVDTLNFTTASSILLDGSNDTVGAGTDVQVNVNGSNNALFMANGDYVGLLAGNDDTVIINDGEVDGANNVTNVILSGSNDTVGAGVGTQINVAGSNDELFMANGDYVGLLSGNSGDTVIMNSGTIATLNTITNALIDGSNDVVSAGTGNQVYANGNGDTFSMSNGDYVGLYAGNGDIVNLNAGELQTAGNISNLVLNGSNDQFITNINVTGTLNGSNNGVGALSGNQMYVNGGGDTLYMSNGDYVGIYAGNANVVNMNAGTLETLGDISNLVLNGSNDAIVVNVNVSIAINGSGDNLLGFNGEAITLNGNADVVSAEQSSSVTLSANDSGDTIDMIGGTIVLGAGLSNITINGTGDVLSGPGASLAGPITETVTSHVLPGGTVIFQTITNTPAVVYNAGNITDLVSYFEANPYLSENQIQAVESDPNYAANLDSYLSSANLYGSPNSLPSSVLSMLDGYSSIYLALTGVSATELSENAYIEQQIGWVEQNYPMPSTIQVSGVTLGIASILQNLMPVLESTNSGVENLLSDALNLMQQGNAGASGGNQTPMLNDSTAEMMLAIAETGGFNASTQASVDVYTPGRSGHWQVIVNGDGTYTQQYKSPPLIQTVLSDLDTYVAPIVDIASVLCLNPEFIALTGLSASVVAGVQVAATAVNLTQAGQDFASGADLQGVLGVIGAVGGALQDIGNAQQLAAFQSEEASGAEVLDNATNVDSILGQALSYGAGIAQSIDGVVAGAESGNILAAITSGLGGVAGLAGLSGESTIEQYAAVGQELGSTALAAQSCNILTALDQMVQAANTSGVLDGIIAGANWLLQDVDSLWDGFQEQSLGVSAASTPDANTSYTDAPGTPYSGQTPGQNLGTLSPTSGVTWGPHDYSILYNANHQEVGISYFDPTDTTDNANLIDCVDANAFQDGLNGQPITFIVAGHGSPDATSIASTPTSTVLNSPESTLKNMQSAGYLPTEAVLLFACNLGSPNPNNATVMQYVSNSTGVGMKPVPENVNGNPTGSDFAQTLANLAHSSNVLAALGYIEGNSQGAYFTSMHELPNDSISNLPSTVGLVAAPTTVTLPNNVQVNVMPGQMIPFSWNRQ